MRRYIVIGTGAVGGTIGGSLARHGLDTVWVARGDHGRVLRERGMTLRTEAGTFQLRAPVWSGPDEAALTPDDVLVLATKTNAVPEAAEAWADVPVAGGGTAGDRLPLLSCTNGIAAEEMALRWFERVYGVCVWCPAVHLQPGEIVARLAPDVASLHVGRVPATLTDGEDAERLAAVREDWTRAGIATHLPVDVLPWKRRKLLTNMGNIVDALLGPGGQGEDGRAIVAALEEEARTVYAAAGVTVTPDDEEADLRGRGPTIADDIEGFDARTQAGSSTWQSLTKGGRLETDFLNGEIVRLAHVAGVPAPRNAAAARLARTASRARERAGGWTAADLAAALGIER